MYTVYTNTVYIYAVGYVYAVYKMVLKIQKIIEIDRNRIQNRLSRIEPKTPEPVLWIAQFVVSPPIFECITPTIELFSQTTL